MTAASGSGPLSYWEEGLWEEWLTDRELFAGRWAAFTVDLPVGVAAGEVRAAVAVVTARHAILRTSYAATAGRPVREVLEHYPHQITGEAAGDPRRLTPCELVEMRLDVGNRELTVRLHEMITDPWSCAQLRSELRSLLTTGPVGWTKPSEEYADYARIERERPAHDVVAAFWRERLTGAANASAGVPETGPDPSGDRAGELVMVLPDRLTDALRHIARRHRISSFMAATALVTMTVATWSEVRDLVLAATSSTRLTRWAQVYGNFTNVAVLRLALGTDLTFGAVVDRCRTVVLEALRQQPMPYRQLNEVVDGGFVPPALRIHYLPRQSHHFDTALDQRSSGDIWREKADVATWPLDLGFAEDARRRMALWTLYDARRYRHATIESLLDRCCQVLEQVAADDSLSRGRLATLVTADPPRRLVHQAHTS